MSTAMGSPPVVDAFTYSAQGLADTYLVHCRHVIDEKSRIARNVVSKDPKLQGMTGPQDTLE